MATLAEQLSALLLKSGVAESDPTLVKIKSLLETVEVPENYLNENLGKAGYMTIESAKNNSDLVKHFRATILNGLDSELANSYADLGLDEATITKLSEEKNSFKRAALLAKTVKELEATKAKATGGDKAAIQAQIDALNKQVSDEKLARQQSEKAIRDEYEGKISDYQMKTLLASLNLVESAKEEQFLLAHTKVKNALAEKGVKIVNENGVQKLVNSEGLDYQENNNKVGLNDFVNKVMADNKYIVTATQQKETAQTVKTEKVNGLDTSRFENEQAPSIPR